MTALDLSQAPSRHRLELWTPDAELWTPPREVVRAAGGYAPGPVQHRRAAASPPVVPTLPAGASWVLDGLDLPSLYQDRPAPGSVPVTADSQLVGTARDGSGSGNHFAAPLDAARYTYLTGSNQRLRAINSVLVGPQITCSSWTVGLCWRMRSVLASGGAASLLVIKTGSGTWIELILTNISGYQQLSFSAGIVSGGVASVGALGATSTSLGTTAHWARLTYNGGSVTAPASYALETETGPQAITTSGALAPSGAGATSSLGARWDGSAGSVQAPVDLAAGFLYPSVLSSGDLAQAGTWLGARL